MDEYDISTKEELHFPDTHYKLHITRSCWLGVYFNSKMTSSAEIYSSVTCHFSL